MIRDYRPGDHVAIAEIFPRAVHEVASREYSEEQCRAWAEREPDSDHWERRCGRKKPFVYVVDGAVVGFCELDPDGHIDCTYTHPDHVRKGVATQLVTHAIEVAGSKGLERVHVEASLCARPLFEKLGFHLIEERDVEIQGVLLKNFKMEKRCR